MEIYTDSTSVSMLWCIEYSAMYSVCTTSSTTMYIMVTACYTDYKYMTSNKCRTGW